ncbi:MAG: ester cyclase [Myxococcota bacterium]
MSSPAGTEQILRTWFDRVWKQRDANAIDELFVPSGRAQGLSPDQVVGPKEFRAFFELLTNAVENTDFIVDDLMTHGPDLMFLGRFTGTHTKSGRRVECRVAGTGRVEKGKIVASTNVVDFVTLLQQIGKAPADLVPAALLA